MKKILLISAILIFINLCSLAVFILNLRHYAQQPAGQTPEKVVILIPAGQSLRATTEALFKNGIITSPFKFNLVARFKGYDKRLKAGEYVLSATMAPIQIMEKLVKGEIELYKLTVLPDCRSRDPGWIYTEFQLYRDRNRCRYGSQKQYSR
jgi:UPF0755 protein